MAFRFQLLRELIQFLSAIPKDSNNTIFHFFLLLNGSVPSRNLFIFLFFLIKPSRLKHLLSVKKRYASLPRQCRSPKKEFLCPAKGTNPMGTGIYIDSYHSAVRMPYEFPCIISALRENYGTIGIRVAIHQAEAFFKVFDSLHTEPARKFLPCRCSYLPIRDQKQ